MTAVLQPLAKASNTGIEEKKKNRIDSFLLKALNRVLLLLFSVTMLVMTNLAAQIRNQALKSGFESGLGWVLSEGSPPIWFASSHIKKKYPPTRKAPLFPQFLFNSNSF